LALSGLRRALSTRPVHPVGEDGRMALSDHLRELRGRLIRIALALVVATGLCLFFFDPIFDAVLGPYNQAQRALGEDVTMPTTNGAGGPLMLYLKLCGLAALVGTSPYWLYQVWAFILPGLHAGERRWSRIFAAIAGPLFLAGVAVGYLTLPKGLEVLISFTPANLINLVEFGDYLTFFSRTLFVFGISFEIPVFIVLLNLAGILSARSLAEHRAWFVIGIFAFAALATPSTDPFTMLFLAIPMCGLFLASEVVCRIIDRRRARVAALGPGPDEASVL
jgi:sec-independent protein translocase protein TatC